MVNYGRNFLLKYFCIKKKKRVSKSKITPRSEQDKRNWDEWDKNGAGAAIYLKVFLSYMLCSYWHNNPKKVETIYVQWRGYYKNVINNLRFSTFVFVLQEA